MKTLQNVLFGIIMEVTQTMAVIKAGPSARTTSVPVRVMEAIKATAKLVTRMEGMMPVEAEAETEMARVTVLGTLLRCTPHTHGLRNVAGRLRRHSRIT